MSSTGSISMSGILGGTAGQIDTTSLIANLMQAAAVPQNQLKDQLNSLQNRQGALQAVNTKMTSLLTAAQALTDPGAWSASSATSSSSAVVASSDGTATGGTFTFDVTALARAQVTTFAVAADDTVVTDPTQGLTLTDGNGQLHAITLTDGTSDSVAGAINGANLGVRAVVVTTDQGKVLQLVSQKTGTANSFQVAGFDAAAKDVVTAADAQVTVGTVGSNSSGYTLSSSSNTFTNLWPGVTVSVGALASGVTVNVSTDGKSIADKLKTLVTAANTARGLVDSTTAKGAPLAGRYEILGLRNSIVDSVAQGLNGNGSLKKYGLDVDKSGTISLDADAFAAAYAADPSGTKAAVADAFASRLAATGSSATAAGTGTITQSLAESSQRSDTITKQIDNWTTRLNRIQSDLQVKYSAMQSALARLQSQQTYLESMLKSASGSSSGSGS